MSPEGLERKRAEVEIIEEIMVRGNELAIARLYKQLHVRGVTECFETELLCKYFTKKLQLVKKHSAKNDGWFEKILDGSSVSEFLNDIAENSKKDHSESSQIFHTRLAPGFVDEKLRLSATSLVWLARERAVITSTLNQQKNVTVKALAALVTAALWLLGGFAAYIAPADTDCMSVCPINTTV